MQDYPNIDVHISATVSLLNIYYADEIWDFLTREGFRCDFNILHQPHYINARIAPNEVKKSITKKLESFQPTHNQSDWVRQRSFITNFLNLDFDNAQKHWQEFWHFTTAYDELRKESYAETFPESYKILADYR